jgi:hypothetical protein
VATANIDLPNGTKVVIEGSPEEIARMVNLICGLTRPDFEPSASREIAVLGRSLARARTPQVDIPRATGGVAQFVREMIAENFFGEPRSLADVKRRLADLGHIYPLTHLSTPMRRLVRSKELRRLRQGRNWVYVAI